MDASNYLATTYWVIGVNLIFLIATLWLLNIGRATQKTKWVFGLISIAWIIFFHFVFSNKLLIPTDISGGAFYALTLSSATLVLVVFYFSPLKKIFENISQENIQIVQGLRVFVASGFLMEGILQVIPAWFSIMDGFLHVSSGFLALLASIAVVKNQTSKNTLLWLANIVGVLDIVIIVTSISLIVWKDLGVFHNMQYVVFYTGVLLLWFHFVSISKLIKSNK
ncbi:hypothetical protein [Flavobacterium columnare]|jgi:hypothetical protein|uniref:hypothetical protein n=1 Tax=Flavobacterium columnare TaxID=996 RepID=UPI004034BB5C